MKKPLLLFYFTCCILHFSSAQNPLVKMWDKRFGGTEQDWLSCFKQTADGGYILGGGSYSDSSGDKSQHNWDWNNDYWIVKIDSIGNKQWDKRFGGVGNDFLLSLEQTPDGGYILGGDSNSDSTGDKTQVNWDTTLQTGDYWMVKIDSLGNKQWDKRFGGTKNDWLESLEQTSDGGYILGGLSYSDSSGDKSQPNWSPIFLQKADYWVVKTDSLGNKQWDKRFGGTDDDELYAIHQTNDGNYILGGSSISDSSGDVTQNSVGGLDYWIVKIDLYGNKLWDKRFGGTAFDYFLSMQQTFNHGFILFGYSNSGVGGDKSQPVWGGFNDQDYWIVKIDSLGNKEWDKDFGGTGIENDMGNISQTDDGGYLFAGASGSPISGNKTENNLGAEQTWVVKTDSLGIKQWDKTVFTLSNPDDEMGFAFQTKDGCYAIANCTDAGIGGYKTQPNWDTTFVLTPDYWIIKFCDSTLTTSITQLPDQPNTFSISPNPANEVLVIRDKALGKKEIEIYDLFGRRVLHSSIFNRQSSIDISSLSPGIYFLKAGNEVRKFVKE